LDTKWSVLCPCYSSYYHTIRQSNDQQKFEENVETKSVPVVARQKNKKCAPTSSTHTKRFYHLPRENETSESRRSKLSLLPEKNKKKLLYCIMNHTFYPSHVMYRSNLDASREIRDCDKNFGTSSMEYTSSVKRQREHHMIHHHSRHNNSYLSGKNNGHTENSMMDLDKDSIGPNKRRRFAHNFSFDNNIKTIELHRGEFNAVRNESTLVEGGTGMDISNDDKKIMFTESCGEKQSLGTAPITTAIETRSIIEQEALTPCTAMDTSLGEDQIRCHICLNTFSRPIVPPIREVMPVNAILNYFSPLKKGRVSNNDVVMATNNSQNFMERAITHQNCSKSPACCPCCDRFSCPECRQKCKACQKSFCSFCTITTYDHIAKSSDSFCLDCYDRCQ